MYDFSDTEEDVHWKLSSQENFARMKVKLTQNYHFEDHITASHLRDNIGRFCLDLLIISMSGT